MVKESEVKTCNCRTVSKVTYDEDPHVVCVLVQWLCGDLRMFGH